MKTVDVYAYGVIASSTLHLLNCPFPSSDGYAEITQTYSMTGGEALNSSIVLGRLGLRVLLDGNWIGDTPEGKMLLEIAEKHNIDTSRLRIKKGYPGVREIVFSDTQSRTIFGNYIDLLATTRKWNIPRKADLARSRMVCVDPPFQAESALVGQYSTELGIPYITIDCPYDQELSIGAEAVIVSGEFRAREYQKADLAELFSAYQKYAKGLIVLTVGSEEILYGRKGESIKRFKPYAVKVTDSAGAGDSFRAGIMYGMLKKWHDDEVIQYAAALAGMVCERFPGVLNSPTHAEVTRFIQEKQKDKK
jgi:sugar/nucleoside kinase (ribokinase family)